MPDILKVIGVALWMILLSWQSTKLVAITRAIQRHSISRAEGKKSLAIISIGLAVMIGLAIILGDFLDLPIRFLLIGLSISAGAFLGLKAAKRSLESDNQI